jgi:hypothetical protein
VGAGQRWDPWLGAAGEPSGFRGEGPNLGRGRVPARWHRGLFN